jgi:hypothetical protein
VNTLWPNPSMCTVRPDSALLTDALRLPLRIAIAFLLLLSGIVAGCLPIAPAHQTVSVPPLQVALHAQADEIPIAVELVQPKFWAAAQTFVDLVKAVPSHERDQHDARSVNASERITSVLFNAEERYVAVPAISFLPDDPFTGKHHTLFIRIGSEDQIHRISIDRKTARIHVTRITSARKSLSSLLDDPRPPFPRPYTVAAYKPLEKWNEAARRFYESTEWAPSRRITLLSLERTSARDSLALQIRTKREG